MTANYRIAERIICVASLFEEVHQFLYAYRTEGQQIDFSVAITLSDIAFERERSEAERQIEGLSPHHFSDPYLETLAVYRKIAEKMPDYGVFFSTDPVLQQVYRPYDRAAMAKTLELIDRLADSVDLWKMQCNMDIEAAEIAYSAMSEAFRQGIYETEKRILDPQYK